MPLRGHDPFRTVHVVRLALCAIMLPWSTAFLSIAQMLMVVNWLAEGVVRKDLQAAVFEPTSPSQPALVFLSFFRPACGRSVVDHGSWSGVRTSCGSCCPCSRSARCWRALARLEHEEFRTASCVLGAWSVIASTLVCLVMRTGDAMDYRSLSVFISHIRLSLLLCLAVVVFLMDRSAPHRWSCALAGMLAVALGALLHQ